MVVMHFWRTDRGPIAACLILLLLFMQAATAVYACPQRDMPSSPHMDMSGCDEAGDRAGMDPQQPLLCVADCGQNAQAAQASATPDVPAAALPDLVVALLPSIFDPPGLDASTEPATRGEPPPGWPPPYLLHRVLLN
jgi:hypothetical protein